MHVGRLDGVKGPRAAFHRRRQAAYPSERYPRGPCRREFLSEAVSDLKRLVRFEEAQLSLLCGSTPRARGGDGKRLPRAPLLIP